MKGAISWACHGPPCPRVVRSFVPRTTPGHLQRPVQLGTTVIGTSGTAHVPAAQLSRLPQGSSWLVLRPVAGGGFEVEGELLHVYDYIPGNEPSTIGDFRGLVAINHLAGEGTVLRGSNSGGISTPTATNDRLVYDADMRVMKGLYIGEDGQEHEGTFGFI